MKALFALVAASVLAGAFASSSSMSSMSMSSMDSSSMAMGSSSSMAMASSSQASSMAMASSSMASSVDSDMSSMASSAMASSMASTAADSSMSSMESSDNVAGPTGVAFTLNAPIKGGDNVPVNFGTAPAGNNLAKVQLYCPKADGSGNDKYLTFGPAAYPTGQTLNAVMPVLVNQRAGCWLVVETTTSEGVVIESCASCQSATFTLEKGGLAADSDAIAAAEAGPPQGTAPAPTILFYLLFSENGGKKLTRQEALDVFNAIDFSALTAPQAFNLLAAIGRLYVPESGAPTPDETTKVNQLVERMLQRVNGIRPVFSLSESNALFLAAFNLLKGFGLRRNGQKVAAQLTVTQQQAVAIPEALRAMRLIRASTAAAGGNFNTGSICSDVVTAANLANDHCTGGNFPNVINVAGAPATNNHRLTAAAMSLAEMRVSDQRLTNTLSLTSAVSPHYADIAAPLVAIAAAQLTSTFDSAKGASSNDVTFNCYQRVVTPNRDPSGDYVQLPAAQQNRVSATVLTCRGANSNEFRWVTLAKGSNPAPAAATGGDATSTIATPAPTSRAVTAASSDDGSASGVIGGVLGGVGCVLLILAVVAVLALKKGKSSSNAAGYPDAGDMSYSQNNGAYKVPASTPVVVY